MAKSNSKGLTIRFYQEVQEVSLEQGKDVIAVFRENGFIKDIDKKRLKGRLFQFSVSTTEDKSLLVDLIVPFDSIDKKDQKFVKSFFKSEQEPPEKDFEKILSLTLNSITFEYKSLIGQDIKKPKNKNENITIENVFKKIKTNLSECKKGYVTDVNFLLFPKLVAIKVLVVS